MCMVMQDTHTCSMWLLLDHRDNSEWVIMQPGGLMTKKKQAKVLKPLTDDYGVIGSYSKKPCKPVYNIYYIREDERVRQGRDKLIWKKENVC